MKFKNILIYIFVLIFFSLNCVFVNAHTPYITYTMGYNGEILDTQTAFTPNDILKYNINLPEDFFIDNEGTIYICDTGNKRILIVYKNGTQKEINNLSKPTGIYVLNGNIYVADYDTKSIYIYDKNLNLKSTIEKPTEAIFGKNTKFSPYKISADKRGNVYVVSEGSNSGIMQFNPNGEFLGFFGSNFTNNSFKNILLKKIFGEEQFEKLFKNIPASVTNITIDEQGLVYTVTKGELSDGIKKLNIAGKNLFPSNMFSLDYIIDIDVDKYGNIFAISEEGKIVVYDSYGQMIFLFGGKDNNLERLGIPYNPIAIEIDEQGNLYILDKEKNYILKYSQTYFSKKIFEGISMYKEGLYEESYSIWQEIQSKNSGFKISYDALAKANYKQEQYENALTNYEIAGNYNGYSQTFWIFRNNWLQENLAKTIIIIFFVCVIFYILRKIDKRKNIFNNLRNIKEKIFNLPILKDFKYLKYVITKPLDTYYDIKVRKKVSTVSATILYIWLFILQITNIYITGYLFNKTPKDITITKTFMYLFLPIFIWIICNYLVSTIRDGEGEIKDLYCGIIYSLSPYLIFALPLQIISNALTFNEAFIYDFSMAFIYGICLILLFLMTKEIHSYSIKQTIKNIFITIFTIILFILISIILYLLFIQLKDFIYGLIQEVIIRV